MSMKLENSNGCKNDFLEIRDGGDENSDIIGTYCGSDSPGQLVSQGNQLYFKFVSDINKSAKGFEVAYESIDTQLVKDSF